MVFPKTLVALAAVACAAAIDMALESAGRSTISFLGKTLAAPSGRASALIVCAVSAAAALALVTAIANVRGRRLERRMAAELDGRWEQLSRQHAGDMARYELLSWRTAELQTSLDELLAKRDEAYEEFRRTRQRVLELREKAIRQREALRELAHVAESQLIVLPDLPAELLAAGEGSEPIIEAWRPSV